MDRRYKDLPEAFHRLKRALLLWSSVLLILAIAATDADEVNYSGVALSVKPVMLMFLAGCASFYYWIGFSVEAISAKREYSGFVESSGLSDFNEAIAQSANHLKNDIFSGLPSGEIASSVAVIRQKMTEFSEDYDDKFLTFIDDEIAYLKTMQQSGDGMSRQNANREWFKRFQEKFASYAKSMRSRIRIELEGKSHGLIEEIDVLKRKSDEAMIAHQGALEKQEALLKSIKTLRSDLTRERRWGLEWWDMKAPSIFFVAAISAALLASTIGPLGPHIDALIARSLAALVSATT